MKIGGGRFVTGYVLVFLQSKGVVKTAATKSDNTTIPDRIWSNDEILSIKEEGPPVFHLTSLFILLSVM